MRPTPAAIVFDFDGVVADSEGIANASLAASLTQMGLATTMDDCLRDYCGHNWRETERLIEVRLGGPLPGDFRVQLRARNRTALEQGLESVRGVSAFLDRYARVPKAIASSSGLEYLHWALAKLGLAHHFDGHFYSAEGMARGKPFPDIYLKAARGLGMPAERCLAIEDSPIGARAAVAAGMTVVGLAAAGHIADREGHIDALRAAGVHQIARGFAAIELEPAAA